MSGLLILCTELTFLRIELPENYIYLNQSELSNFFMHIFRNSFLSPPHLSLSLPPLSPPLSLPSLPSLPLSPPLSPLSLPLSPPLSPSLSPLSPSLPLSLKVK